MQANIEYTTPPTTPRTQEKIRLRTHANGAFFAPAPKGSEAEAAREKLVEQYVQEGLQQYAQQQNQAAAAAPR